MTDGMQMDTDAATGAMSSLAAADTDLQQAWSGARGQLDSLGGQLGDGLLGQAFTAAYRPAVTSVDQKVQQLVRTGLKLVEAGKQSIADYVRMDNLAASSFTLPHH
ncbi:hypothetical protein GCM10022222_80190 [Amycolatopsis ultiminotia]|uniref:Excreted virulence factor EspC, type VII ESX diderm n=1 Tax=Amycolatopsis ultiminotia TaxID=543629 RepID=A0ABP6YJY2_9PSEU